VNLSANCLASGACSFSADQSGSAISACYANGVTQSWVTTTTGDITIVESVVKNSGSVCYSMESIQESNTTMGTIKDANGAVVATFTDGANGQAPTVTCGDQNPIVGYFCSNIIPGPGADVPCLGGVCSP